MGRLPIRIRLTLPFALAMAAVLAALGAYVYLRVGSTLLSSTDQSLLAQATEATLRIDRDKSPLDPDSANGARFAQVLDRTGAVVLSQPTALSPLLSQADARRVAGGGSLRRSSTIAGQTGRWRLLAIPETSSGSHGALVLASSLDARSESLERLRKELLVASPLALLLATLAGYALAGAALRPVEEMRRKAAQISAATPDSRLPVPAAKDEVQRLAETLNDMLARLETAFRHERRFVADASHELRTPLALLKTELELALRHPRSRAELEDALRSAAEETDRLSALAVDLLLVARSDQGGIPVNPEPLESGEVLTTVAARFAGRAAELGRRLEVDDGGVDFDADPKRIEQALGNLVENALVHGAGTVTLAAGRRDGRVELCVADEGPGFPEGFADRAFDRFSRADEARSRSGSGLGLAIVEAIAKAHGGAAGLSVGSRTEVWVSLPAGPEARRAKARPSLTSRA
jgi:two-component system, OmpR family, sensor kinase